MERKCKDITTFFFLRIILKWMSTEYVYMRRHQGAKVEHFDVSNVIYHKFSYGPVSYTLNEEHVNAMLESFLSGALGPVVQSIVSLTSSLRGQLIK